MHKHFQKLLRPKPTAYGNTKGRQFLNIDHWGLKYQSIQGISEKAFKKGQSDRFVYFLPNLHAISLFGRPAATIHIIQLICKQALKSFIKMRMRSFLLKRDF